MADGRPNCDNARRAFLERCLALSGASAIIAGGSWWLARRGGAPHESEAPAVPARDTTVPRDARFPDLAAVRGAGPRETVRRAIEELGGISRFIRRGDVVAIKPNASWNRTPEQAATTNPEIVAEVVRLCRAAGARRVIVADATINDAPSCFERSGIGAAARLEGGEVVLPEAHRFREVDLRGQVLGAWPVFVPFLEADKIINLPIAKHHTLTGATLGMKNWYGVLGGQRQRLHQRIHECVTDLAAFFRPSLTLLDAWRVLVRNGPAGGSPSDVALERTVVGGTDPVGVDAWAAKAYWGLDHRALRSLELAAARGLGSFELAAPRVRTVGL